MLAWFDLPVDVGQNIDTLLAVADAFTGDEFAHKQTQNSVIDD